MSSSVDTRRAVQQQNRFKVLTAPTTGYTSSVKRLGTPSGLQSSGSTPTKRKRTESSDGKSAANKRLSTPANSLRASLPRHLQLRALKVKDPTLNRYNERVLAFEAYCRNKRITLSSHDKVDKGLAEFFADLLR